MRAIQSGSVAIAWCLISAGTVFSQSFALDSASGLEPHGVKAEPAMFLQRKAIHVYAADAQASDGGLVVVRGAEFGNGSLEVDLSGKPGAGAPGGARGFVGLAFHAAADVSKYECFYLRPTNGRAEDQERRNHSLQYISYPAYEWFRLRKENPGKYESYADLVPGEWMHIRIEVQGVKARLYVNGAAQPALIVNDLKMGDGKGGVALWIGPGTDAYFSNLKLSH